MERRVIDMEKDPRREQFQLFSGYSFPYAGVTVQLDVTALELRLRADLRRHVFPPFDRGRRRDGGAPQGARHCCLRRKRADSDAGGHGCTVRSQIK